MLLSSIEDDDDIFWVISHMTTLELITNCSFFSKMNLPFNIFFSNSE